MTPPAPGFWVRSYTSSGRVSVDPATSEETTSTAPISPSARAVERITPYRTPQRIEGSVIRRKVCQPEAPSVAAACSCSSPISASTGATSRTTNGSETNTVARIIPVGAKMIWMPRLANQLPNHPWMP